jgi:hypothetical protein
MNIALGIGLLLVFLLGDLLHLWGERRKARKKRDEHDWDGDY